MKKITRLLNLILHKPFDTSTVKGREKERERRIAITAITGAAAKVIASAIPLITVKFSLGYLGQETYGLWTAVISFFSLFTFSDLGLGNGLQTELSRANGQDDEALSRRLVSSASFMLTAISTVIMLLFLLVYPFVNWATLMNAETESAIALAGSVVLAIVVSKILNIPVALVQRTQIALQEGYKSNLWQCAGSILSLISVIAVSKLDLGPLTMIWVSSLIVVVVSALNSIVFFGCQKPQLCPHMGYISKLQVRMLFKTGIAFFFLSILTSISLSMDSFIVARVMSLSDSAPYSISYKIAHLISIVTAMLATPLWAANGEAIVRGDIAWVKKSTRSMALLSVALSTLVSAVLMLITNPVLFWMKDGMTIPLFTLTGMCVMQIAVSAASPYFMVMNAQRVVGRQIVIYGIFTIVSLGLKIFFAESLGTAGIAWIGTLSYIVIILPYTIVQAKRILEGLK